jgi:hypothetical protein
MPYDPQRHDRQSLRLQEYDYGQPGAYFVTICVENKHCLLGAIRSGCVRLNKYGRIVHDEWQRTPEIRPDDFRSPSHTLGAIVRGFKRSRHAARQRTTRYARRTRLATQLLGTHHPGPPSFTHRPPVYRSQPAPMAP